MWLGQNPAAISERMADGRSKLTHSCEGLLAHRFRAAAALGFTGAVLLLATVCPQAIGREKQREFAIGDQSSETGQKERSKTYLREAAEMRGDGAFR